MRPHRIAEIPRVSRRKFELLGAILLALLSHSPVSGAPIKLVYDFPAYALLFGDANQQLQQQSQHQLMESVQQQADQTLEPSRMAHRPHADGSTSTDDPLDTALGLIESTIKSLAVPHDPKLLNSSFIPSAIANATVDQINDSSMAPQVDLSLALSPTGPIGQGERRSGLIRLPHSHSYQICSNSSECEAPNTICVMDVCVCKPGYYVQSSSCLSFRDLLKDCQNDRQCQAINVDLICDNESNERPVCDCPVGLYFEQETHRCLPCHRSILIHSSSNSSQKNRSIHHETIDLKPNENVAELVYKPNSTNSTDQLLSSRADIKLEEATSGHLLRPCLPLRQIPWMTNSIRPLTRAQEKFNSRTTLTTTNVNLTPTGLYGHSASDPFRIKTPLHVFMGAIMLFTLFTVAWFFLQRMIHDCRAIMKSLRNPDQFGPATSAGDHSTVGTLTNRTSSHHFFDPTSQAVARLISGDSVYGCNQPFANISSGLLQRDLAGVMVQQLAANLTPSSTSNTLVGNSSTRTLSSGLGPNNEHEASLYSFGPTGGSQSRHMAAAAAAQLLLSPNHPAIAILRAAAASVAHNPCSTDYASANLLSSILDPPPKYEEAIAQSTRISYSNPLGEIHDQTNQSSEQGENL